MESLYVDIAALAAPCTARKLFCAPAGPPAAAVQGQSQGPGRLGPGRGFARAAGASAAQPQAGQHEKDKLTATLATAAYLNDPLCTNCRTSTLTGFHQALYGDLVPVRPEPGLARLAAGGL